MNEPIDHLRETLTDLMRWVSGEELSATIIGGVAAGLDDGGRGAAAPM